MIFWKDFVLDDVTGPLLIVAAASTDEHPASCRKTRLGRPNIMDDVNGNAIQETGQEIRPARMAGLSSLDSAQSDTEVSRGDQVASVRRGGER